MTTIEIRRQQFAAVIATVTQRPEWTLCREGWNGGEESTLIVPRDATKNGLFEQFCTAIDFIEALNVERTANPTASITSRDLKTYYETVCNGYACHGAFILAAIATGFANACPNDRHELSASHLTISKRVWNHLMKPRR